MIWRVGKLNSFHCTVILYFYVCVDCMLSIYQYKKYQFSHILHTGPFRLQQTLPGYSPDKPKQKDNWSCVASAWLKINDALCLLALSISQSKPSSQCALLNYYNYYYSQLCHIHLSMNSANECFQNVKSDLILAALKFNCFCVQWVLFKKRIFFLTCRHNHSEGELRVVFFFNVNGCF